MLKTPTKRIFGLDFLRAIAIILVFVSHLFWILPEVTGVYSHIVRFLGVIGVEIFFVLSGFLIGRIIINIFLSDKFNKNSIGYFLVRRWFRTLPNYYLVLIINIFIAIALGFQLPKNLWSYFLFLQNFSSAPTSFFSESWSLSIEEFAYIIGPILLFICMLFSRNKNKKAQFFKIILLIISCFLLLKIVYYIFNKNTTLQDWNNNLKNVLIYRIDAIYYGFFAAYCFVFKNNKWVKYKYNCFLLGIIFFITCNLVVFKLEGNSPKFLLNVFYLPIISIAISLCLPVFVLWKTSKGLLSRFIKKVSLISYAVYLLHYSIILKLMKYYIPTEQLSLFDKLVFAIVYCGITFIASYILFRFFEQPLTKIRDNTKIRNVFRV